MGRELKISTHDRGGDNFIQIRWFQWKTFFFFVLFGCLTSALAIYPEFIFGEHPPALYIEHRSAIRVLIALLAIYTLYSFASIVWNSTFIEIAMGQITLTHGPLKQPMIWKRVRPIRLHEIENFSLRAQKVYHSQYAGTSARMGIHYLLIARLKEAAIPITPSVGAAPTSRLRKIFNERRKARIQERVLVDFYHFREDAEAVLQILQQVVMSKNAP